MPFATRLHYSLIRPCECRGDAAPGRVCFSGTISLGSCAAGGMKDKTRVDVEPEPLNKIIGDSHVARCFVANAPQSEEAPA